MNIVVCVKQVPDTTVVKIDPVKHTLIRDGVPSIMNPDDKGGLELALQLKEKCGANVTVITMGPPQADLVLREAFAMGADRAILLTSRAFAGADTLATSNALAGALKAIPYDLIITGRQAIDGDTAQVGPEMAEHLALPQVSYVVDCEYKGGNNFRVKKETEDGYEILDVEGPAVFTVLASGYKARYMSVGGIVDAFDRQVEIWTEANLDIDPGKLGLKGSPTKVMKAFTKATKAAGQVYEVDAEQAVDVIITKMKEKFII
ncbi:MAG: electron transfer flavoprotein subunit beta/FixA family protein [Bacteroidales bacterium]|nr:electron transfer flavoprotein subunit beta/FixA family protein [Bacteroidales bacterium]MBR5399242.1 electron transfer flavoprotein subunit beta/FixA family protein [Bacteroidales bacterium]MBR6465385.1 electron transfer flavoprotein subunit beta/FixA family protein [Bacteroidales bacterium]